MKTDRVSQLFQVSVHYYRTERTEDGRGKRTVIDRTTEETVEVPVDFAALARRLGPKACRSKGGKAVDAAGLVVVRPVRRKAASP
jgi:hypothetical protein